MDRAMASASFLRASRNSSRNARFSAQLEVSPPEARAYLRSNLAALPWRFSAGLGTEA